MSAENTSGLRLNQWAMQAEVTWGAKTIGRLAGVCEHTVYRWERLPDCPITKVNGRYFVLKSLLIRWLTEKHVA